MVLLHLWRPFLYLVFNTIYDYFCPFYHSTWNRVNLQTQNDPPAPMTLIDSQCDFPFWLDRSHAAHRRPSSQSIMSTDNTICRPTLQLVVSRQMTGGVKTSPIYIEPKHFWHRHTKEFVSCFSIETRYTYICSERYMTCACNFWFTQYCTIEQH